MFVNMSDATKNITKHDLWKYISSGAIRQTGTPVCVIAVNGGALIYDFISLPRLSYIVKKTFGID